MSETMIARMPVNGLTLRFSAGTLETAFAEEYAPGARMQVRFALLLAILLYALFGILDAWAVPDAAPKIWLIRAGVCLFLLLTLAATYRAFFLRQMQAWLIMTMLTTAAGILAMIYIVDDEGGYYYYAGLMLVVFYGHALLRLRFVYATLASLVLVFAYHFIAHLKGTPLPFILNNSFFLVSAVILGMGASYMLEFYMRSVFWQARLLEEKRRELDAEHARKTKELEGARQLQMAMLPKCPPFHPAASMAASIQTSSEVGGDYYDFDVAADGSVTFIIGDATGHGAAAGIMVTATKILFTSMAEEQDLVQIINKANAVLRRVGLSKVYMAAALGRYMNGEVALVGAGMPPALLYRAASGLVEQVPLKGMPLGSCVHFPYAQTRLRLAPEDTLLFMSDGFPELFNPEHEMFGYDRVVELFSDSMPAAPEEIIRHFEEAARQWAPDCTPNDDITFVVLQPRPLSTP